MVVLREVDQQNFEECCGLKRQSSKFVGNAESVLAEAYIFRAHSTAYAIYNDDIVIGLVIVLDRPRSCDKYYFLPICLLLIIFLEMVTENKRYKLFLISSELKKSGIQLKYRFINLTT